MSNVQRQTPIKCALSSCSIEFEPVGPMHIYHTGKCRTNAFYERMGIQAKDRERTSILNYLGALSDRLFGETKPIKVQREQLDRIIRMIKQRLGEP